MNPVEVRLTKKNAQGYVIPIGPVNLVFVKTDTGMAGCGAFDVLALEKFGYPAAKVKATSGTTSITDIDDLLSGEIVVANGPAKKLGVLLGMSGREALELL
ncbi:MAG: YunC family protein [Euryarchaeota archaeon]|nr:YunC family protein [Euryarchaeota archaeon]